MHLDAISGTGSGATVPLAWLLSVAPPNIPFAQLSECCPPATLRNLKEFLSKPSLKT